MVVGLGRGSAPLEGASHVLVACSLLIRGAAALFLVPVSIDLIPLLSLYPLFIWASMSRLSALIKGKVIMQTEGVM